MPIGIRHSEGSVKARDLGLSTKSGSWTYFRRVCAGVSRAMVVVEEESWVEGCRSLETSAGGGIPR